jgi:hypothetical protein
MGRNAPKVKSKCRLCEMEVAGGQARFHHMKRHEREGLTKIIPVGTFRTFRDAHNNIRGYRTSYTEYDDTPAGAERAAEIAKKRLEERRKRHAEG